MFRPAVLATLVVVVFAAAGATGAVLYSRHRAPHETARNSGESVRTTAPPGQGTSVPGLAGTASGQSPPPGATPAPAQTPLGGSPVTVAPAAAQHPDVSSVATFLGRYFAAINTHDYQSYASLLSSQLRQGLTAEQFDKGYGSTADSAETLVNISSAANGDLAVAVTFTSHQNPADSPDHQESCTDWNISLFLGQGGQGGTGYLLDTPPPGYRSSHQPCS